MQQFKISSSSALQLFQQFFVQSHPLRLCVFSALPLAHACLPRTLHRLCGCCAPSDHKRHLRFASLLQGLVGAERSKVSTGIIARQAACKSCSRFASLLRLSEGLWVLSTAKFPLGSLHTKQPACNFLRACSSNRGVQIKSAFPSRAPSKASAPKQDLTSTELKSGSVSLHFSFASRSFLTRSVA